MTLDDGEPMGLPAGTDWHLQSSGTTTNVGTEIASFFSETSIKPKIVSVVRQSLNVISLDKQLFLFTEQHAAGKLFNSGVEGICLTEDASLMAVGEETGFIHLERVIMEEERLELEEIQSTNILPKCAESPGAFEKLQFHQPYGGGNISLLCLAKSGTLIILSGIKAIKAGAQIDLSEVKVSSIVSPQRHTWDFAAYGQSVITVGNGQECLSVYTKVDGSFTLEDVCMLDDCPDMRKVEVLADGGILLSSDAKGTFYLWDALTLLVLKTWTMSDVTDWRPVEANPTDSFSLDKLKLIIVQTSQIQVLSLPSLATETAHEVFGSVQLSYADKTSDHVFATELTVMDDDGDLEAKLSFRCYTETNPEKRVQRLIAKQRFEEAQALAKLYNLDYDLTAQIVQVSMRKAQPTYSEMEQHLVDCLKKLNTAGDGPLEMGVKFELIQLQIRLKSYAVAFGKDQYSAEEWGNFQHEHPFPIFLRLLVTEEGNAFRFWKCRQLELLSRYRSGLLDVLRQVPNGVSRSSLAQWLCNDVVPNVMQIDPHVFGVVLDWTCQQVTAMEKENQVDWEKEAITLCDMVYTGLEAALPQTIDRYALQNPDVVEVDVDILEPLLKVKSLLEWLQELRTKFGFTFTINTLRQETKESIVYRMLDKIVAVDLMAPTLKNQILPYIKQHELSADEIFASYVQELLQQTFEGGSVYGSTSCETKVKAIIDVIKEPKDKVVAVMNLLDHSSLPLPDFVEGVVQEVLDTVTHPLIPTLLEKWKLKEATNLMKFYGIKPGLLAQYHMWDVLKSMVAKGTPQALKDARKVMTAYRLEHYHRPLAFFQSICYIAWDQLDKLAEFWSSEPSPLVLACCCYVMELAEALFQDGGDELMKSSRCKYYKAVRLAVSFFRTLELDELYLKEMMQKYEVIRRAYELETMVEVETPQNKTEAMDLMQEAVGRLSKEKLIGLPTALNLKPGESVACILRTAAEKSSHPAVKCILCQVAELCLQCVSDSDVAVVDLAYKVLNRQSEDLASVYRLTQHVYTHCLPENQLSAMMLSKILYVLKKTFSLCQDTEEVSALTREVETWDWECGFFQETDRTMHSELAVTDLAEALMLPQEEEEEDSNELWAKLEGIVNYMVNNEQTLLALATTQLAILDWKVLSSAEDSQLATALMVEQPKQAGLVALQNAIRKSGNNYRKIKRLSLVASSVAHCLEDEKLIASSERFVKVAKWNNRLLKIGETSLLTIGSTSISEVFSIIDKLVESAQCSPEVLAEYFSDFGLDFEQLDGKLGKLLTFHLSPHAETQLTPAGLQKAKEIINAMSDKAEVVAVLKNLFKQTHSYNYSVLEFLLQEILMRESSPEAEKGLQVLKYLKVYKRCSPPSSVELEDREAGADHGNNISPAGLLPEASKDNLPFHELMGSQKWKVIRPEVNEKTLDMWLNMAAILTISKDNLVTTAATNLTNAYIETSTTSALTMNPDLGVSKEFLTLLGQVEQILSRVEDLEQTMFYCHYMYTRLRNVGEKVMALQGCVKYAKKWLECSDQHPEQKAKAQKSIAKFTSELLPLSTRWFLERAQLQELATELVKKKLEPEDLIEKLYCTVDRAEKKLTGKRDVNWAVDKIGEVYQLDTEELRINLIEKWLLGSVGEEDMDKTMTFDAPIDEEGSESDEDLLQRCLYILKSSDGPACLKQIEQLATLGNNGILSVAQRRKAMLCLLKARRHEETDQSELKSELQHLCSLTSLEQLHMPMSAEAFETVDKEAVFIKAFARNKYQKDALAVLCTMSISHKVYSSKLWSQLLDQMLKLGMVDTLREVLMILMNVPEIVRLPVFLKAYQTVNPVD